MTAQFVFHGMAALSFRYADHPAEFGQVAGTLLQALLAQAGHGADAGSAS